VDSLTGSIKTINRNLAKLKSENASVVRADFRSFLKNAAKKGEKYDLIFMDPPYRMHPVIGQEIAGMLPEIVSSKGRVVVESGTRQEISLPGQLLKDKVYGDTRVRIFLFP
jgi:16S rRNA G966 N2-methylase RsmD